MIRRLLPWTWYALAVNFVHRDHLRPGAADPLLLQPGRHLQVLVPAAGRRAGVRRLLDEPESSTATGSIPSERLLGGADHRRGVAAALDRRPARRPLDRLLRVHHRSLRGAVRLGRPGRVSFHLAVDAGPPASRSTSASPGGSRCWSRSTSSASAWWSGSIMTVDLRLLGLAALRYPVSRMAAHAAPLDLGGVRGGGDHRLRHVRHPRAGVRREPGLPRSSSCCCRWRS